MAEPTLLEVFGVNAQQDATLLYISKVDLATVGLVATDANTAESLLAAILVLAQQYLNDANQVSNADQSVVIDDQLDSLTTRNNATYRRKAKTLTFDKLDTSVNFNPNDY